MPVVDRQDARRPAGGGIANWAEVKAQAAAMLGIELSDNDVAERAAAGDRPVRQVLPGPNGFPQIATTSGLVEGDRWAASPAPANAIRTGHAFLDDIAHHAVPVGDHDDNPATPRQALAPDAGTALNNDDGPPSTYDDELLDAPLRHRRRPRQREHRPDRRAPRVPLRAQPAGRGNIKRRAHRRPTTPASTAARAERTSRPAPAVLDYGERLFQAARFVTEMQYQHLVFEEFARKVQPKVNIFGAATTSTIDPAIIGRVRAHGLPLRPLDADRDGRRAPTPTGTHQRHRPARCLPQPARVHDGERRPPTRRGGRRHRPRHDARTSATRSTSSSPRPCATTCSACRWTSPAHQHGARPRHRRPVAQRGAPEFFARHQQLRAGAVRELGGLRLRT